MNRRILALIAALVALALVTVAVTRAGATQPESAMYILSGEHCSEGVLNEVVDVPVYMNMGPGGNCDIFRAFLDYFPAMWTLGSITPGADIPAGTQFIVNPNPVGVLPCTGGASVVQLSVLPLSTPIPAGNGKHLFTLHMIRQNYPQPTGATPVAFNCHVGTTDWTDDMGTWTWGYGYEHTTLVNGCWKLKNGNCDYVGNCPTGSYTPCPKCPDELEKVGVPARSPRPGMPTGVEPSTWSATKGLYR